MQYRKLAAIILVLCVAACTGVKDEPLPLSRENIEKYAASVSRSARKLEPNAGSVLERVDALYRAPLENGLGYSFDRTLRHFFVNRAGITADPESRVFAHLITPGAQAVLMNADEALRAGIISTKTRDLLAILATFRCDHGLLLGNGEWERMSGFLGLVSDCEKEGNGACTAGRLVELAVEREIVPRQMTEIASEDGEEARNGTARNFLISHFNLSRWEGSRLFIGADGYEIEISSFFDDPNAQIITNERVVYLAEQYAQMIKKEKGLLTEKGGAPLRALQSETGNRS